MQPCQNSLGESLRLVGGNVQGEFAKAGQDVQDTGIQTGIVQKMATVMIGKNLHGLLVTILVYW